MYAVYNTSMNHVNNSETISLIMFLQSLVLKMFKILCMSML